MRLFIAINFTVKDRRRMYSAGRKLREAELPVRWVDTDQLHMTLKFLGEVRPERAGEVEAAVARVAEKTEPFAMVVKGAGAFPTMRRPKVIWLGAEASPELRCLKHDLEWELAPQGFEREVRAFHPHITLGRATKEARAGDFRHFEALVDAMDIEREITVRKVDLMESYLSAKGARYETILTAKLGQDAESILSKSR
ncbi:MAG: RNA 2',3'-cyclic phosphodiesterase [Longimicrobiales bacterium]|nr:RNA 2',3'-cyclic phosphodiesterase [Longimicrobiales bacterium]